MLLVASTAATVLLVLLLGGAWWTALRAGTDGVSTHALLWLVLAAVCGFICVGKVFSPQYFLWLLPPAVAGLAVLDGSRRGLVRWTAVLVAAMALTHAFFPYLYHALLRHGPLTPLAQASGLRTSVALAARWVVRSCSASRRAPVNQTITVSTTPCPLKPPPPQCFLSSSPSMPCRPSNW